MDDEGGVKMVMIARYFFSRPTRGTFSMAHDAQREREMHRSTVGISMELQHVYISNKFITLANSCCSLSFTSKMSPGGSGSSLSVLATPLSELGREGTCLPNEQIASFQ